MKDVGSYDEMMKREGCDDNCMDAAGCFDEEGEQFKECADACGCDEGKFCFVFAIERQSLKFMSVYSKTQRQFFLAIFGNSFSLGMNRGGEEKKKQIKLAGFLYPF